MVPANLNRPAKTSWAGEVRMLNASISADKIAHRKGFPWPAEFCCSRAIRPGPGSPFFQQKLGLATVRGTPCECRQNRPHHADGTATPSSVSADSPSAVASTIRLRFHRRVPFLAAHDTLARAEGMQADYGPAALGETRNLVQIQRGVFAGQEISAGFAMGIPGYSKDLLL